MNRSSLNNNDSMSNNGFEPLYLREPSPPRGSNSRAAENYTQNSQIVERIFSRDLVIRPVVRPLVIVGDVRL